MNLSITENRYDETRRLQGDVAAIRGEDFDILFVSLGAPKAKIEAIRNITLESLSLAALKSPREEMDAAMEAYNDAETIADEERALAKLLELARAQSAADQIEKGVLHDIMMMAQTFLAKEG